MAFKHLNKRTNVSLATQSGTILPQDKDREDTGWHCSARTSRAALHHHVCLARSWTSNWGLVEGLAREVRWKRRLTGSTVCVPSFTISLVNLGMESINHIINIFWNRIKHCLSMMPEIFTRTIKTFSILLCRLRSLYYYWPISYVYIIVICRKVWKPNNLSPFQLHPLF